jgi:radical SAM protein with 4Fe4S-binding SPASM domain
MKSINWLHDQGAVVEIHMVPMKPNFKHITPLRDLCAEIGVKKMSLLRFVPQTRGRANVDELGMTKMEFIQMQMIIAEEFAREHPVQLRAGCPIDFRHAIGALPKKAKPCHAGDDLILVRPNGAVHPCAAWKSLPSDSNVRDHSLNDIWYSSHTFNAIREFKETGYTMVSGCAACTFLDSCQTGCPAQRLHAYGNKSMEDLYLACSDPLCPRGNDGCPEAR